MRTPIRFLGICVIVLLAVSALFLTAKTVIADGTVNWDGHGSDNLPCDGMHIVFTPGGNATVTAATLYVNSDGGTAMSQSGNGSFSADVSGNFDSNLTMSVSYVGDLGSGNSVIQLSHCLNLPPPPPPPASATIDVGTCVWNGAESLTQVTVALDHATLDLVGPTNHSFTSSESINVTPGSYTWTATAEAGYELSGPSSGSFDAETCAPPPPPDPGTASVSTGTCHFIGDKSYKDVIIAVNHASLTIDGVGTYTTSQTIQLPTGIYNYTWTADSGYTGSGSGQIEISASCKPDEPKPAPVTGGELPSPLFMLWQWFLSLFN